MVGSHRVRLLNWVARYRLLLAGAGLTVCVLSGNPSTAPVDARQAPANVARPDFEGVWVRFDTIGGGSWDGANAAIQRADLLDAGPASGGAAGGRRGGGPAPARGGARPLGGAGCSGGGFINIMQHSSAFHLVQQKDEVVLVGEMPMTRRIYMDGRAHPDLSVWEGSGVGHSTGKYEGNALVVETVGFAGGGIPGGGRATRETVLTERFEIQPDGLMKATMTWTDPKIYRKPHIYSFFYKKMTNDAFAFEEWCDMSDPAQSQALGGMPNQQAPATPAAVPATR